MKLGINFLQFLFFTAVINCSLHAQDDTTMSQSVADTSEEVMAMQMSHAYSRNLPASRNGSGTSWLPDSSPMFMSMINSGHNSTWMFHGRFVLRYNDQDLFDKGRRGDRKIDAPNWLMASYNKNVGTNGLFNASAMFSLDPLTVGEGGYPLLFQTGETYRGKRLVDRQHPHDLFSGLSIAYTQAISKSIDVTAYFGYPGEPALGPPNFMHRVSALNNPDAPLGHHWQDATHVTFGVATLGVRVYNFKIESSIFNGNEPNENRYDFDPFTLNSYSYRVSFNPAANWALQFSQGFLTSPEPLEPGVDVIRTTASIIHSANLRTINFSESLIWGMNHNKSSGQNQNSILYEGNFQLQRQAFYWKYEFVKKSGIELDLPPDFGNYFNIHAVTLGYNHGLTGAAPVQILLGVQATFNFTPSALRSLYGTTPIGFECYLLLSPHRHEHNMSME